MHISLSLHNHSLMSDGELGIKDLLYTLTRKYNVVAITDHDTLTIPHPLHLRGIRKKFLLLRGIEYSAYGMIHLVGLEPTNPTGLPIEIWASCRVKWIAHPSLSRITPQMFDVLFKNFPDINGVEMFNSGILQIDDNTDNFVGMNFYASDDLHQASQIGASWIEMDVNKLDKEEVIKKLIDGDFTVCTSNKARNKILFI